MVCNIYSYFNILKTVAHFKLPGYMKCHILCCNPLKLSRYVTQHFLITCFIYNKKNQKPAQSDKRSSLSSGKLTSSFLSTCAGILDPAAPLKVRCPRPKSESWPNGTTLAARRECRRAGRRWKKDELHICQPNPPKKIGNTISPSQVTRGSIYNKTQAIYIICRLFNEII